MPGVFWLRLGCGFAEILPRFSFFCIAKWLIPLIIGMVWCNSIPVTHPTLFPLTTQSCPCQPFSILELAPAMELKNLFDSHGPKGAQLSRGPTVFSRDPCSISRGSAACHVLLLPQQRRTSRHC